MYLRDDKNWRDVIYAIDVMYFMFFESEKETENEKVLCVCECAILLYLCEMKLSCISLGLKLDTFEWKVNLM